ncbi:hypothetical protein FCR2A7T_04050 [Flavobacterium cauense R2A-7]|uniref:Uncharacterized protein n=1 Tax=Flavobacterium cauense R2A-7 TaxID=1341154 RepID=V6S5H2_9FLAO|nr:hypothetical protein [Flavobacterium cauense]ESU21943.1 hypothetical protein FCR2A7T_04050 [Flavobacterium cauense R2A-7]KGO81388.1 hypothetical protein Q762_09230 [Flavobacterium cauense R2A-7]TWI13159.1 hypothetical protein IP98_01141 [Flavobacterium cauense R2A-7]
MSFFEDFLVEIGRDGIYYLIKKLGMLIKWLFYRGRIPFSQIKSENWNTRIGFGFMILLSGLILYVLNKAK